MSIADERVQYEAALAEILAGLGGGSVGDISPERMALVNYTKVKLDELIPGGEGVVFSLSSDPNITNPTDLLVNSQMDEATKDVCLSAPLTVLVPAAFDGTAVPFSSGDKTGYIELPASFLRLSSFKMTDWKTDVTIPITPQDPKYKKQKYSATRGGTNKPVAVLNWKNIGTPTPTPKRILEYYSVSSNNTIDKLLYIPEMNAEYFISINPNLLDALAWQCASKVMQITGMTDAAKLAQERVSQAYNNL